MNPVRARRLRTDARLAGAVAAAMALATGELISALGSTRRSLVGGVADEIVDRASGGLVRFAIDAFGTADKPVLVAAIVAIALLLGAVLGQLSVRRPWVGPTGFAAFGALGALAGARDPLASDTLAVLAAATAAIAGSATLWWLLALARRADAAGAPVGEAERIERPSDARASRRAFFGWTGAAGAFAAMAAGGARSLAGRSGAEMARSTVRLPPVPAAGRAGTATDLAIDGLTPYLSPNDRFYRIDTALIVPQVEPSNWSLSVTGLVERPFELTFEELLALATAEEAVTLSCVSNEVGGTLVGNAVWQGVPLRDLLARAGVQREAEQVVGVSVDGFTAGFPTEAAFDGRVAMVAVGMNGEPLPVRHGFPARLVVSGLYGYVSATKWLSEIRLTRWEDVDGYWIPRGWAKEAPVKTQSRIDVPRAGASLPPGPTAIAGVAWAPSRGISRVEVQVDEGPWQSARLGDPLSDDTWVQWVAEWEASPGDHVLRVRATDGTGATQTADVAPPDPDGATGWHTRRVSVSGS